MSPLLAFSDSDKLDLGQRARRQEKESAEMNAAEGSQKDTVLFMASKFLDSKL